MAILSCYAKPKSSDETTSRPEWNGEHRNHWDEENEAPNE